MPEIQGGRVGSVKKLRKSLKKSGKGNKQWIKRVPQNDSIMVRFLTEPDGWFGYYEHYDPSMKKSYPCVTDDCPGCDDDLRRSFKYLVNAVDLDNDRVIPLKIGVDLANRLMISYDKYGDTLMDRDYELSSTGQQLDTTYDREAEPPKRRNLKKYTLLDLGEVLDEAWKDAFEDEDDDDDDDSPRKGKSARVGKPKRKARKSFLDDDDDDEEEDDDEDEDDEDEYDDDDDDDDDEDEEDLEDMSVKELVKLAKSLGIDPAKAKKNKQRLIRLIEKKR